MTESLDGRRIIVTGASSGIGAATARRLASDGASVVLSARREARLADLAADVERQGGEALVVPTDVTDPDAVDELVEETVETFGGVDALVANAGVLRVADPLESLSREAYRELMATNVDGVFYATTAALPHLRERNGHLVFVGSDAAKHPDPSLVAYGATKWWVRGFAGNVEAREGENGVAVTLVNPGDVRTEIEFRDERLVDKYDEAELLAPETVADAVAYALRAPPGATVSEVDVFERDQRSGIYASLLADLRD